MNRYMFTYSWTRLSSLTRGTLETLWTLQVDNIYKQLMKYFYNLSAFVGY